MYFLQLIIFVATFLSFSPFSTYHFCVLMFKTMIIQPKFTFVIMEPFKAYHAVFVLQIVECRMMTYSFQPLLKKIITGRKTRTNRSNKLSL